jgi:hypothetical protein
MVDEMFDRAYQAARAEMNAGIDRKLAQLARTIGDGFKTLHRIEWSAPWDQRNKGPQAH